jgi:hypothetical protein
MFGVFEARRAVSSSAHFQPTMPLSPHSLGARRGARVRGGIVYESNLDTAVSKINPVERFHASGFETSEYLAGSPAG